MKLWVIGAGGLFGSALVRNAAELGWTPFNALTTPWNDPDATIDAIVANRNLFADALAPGEAYAIAWAAGRVTTSSSQAAADLELSVFVRSLKALEELYSSHPGGKFLLSSSAGGIYAGSDNPPFSSFTAPKPIGVYGHLKVDQERATQELARAAKTVVIARIANLYGPGQDLSKLQGLISRLALASITRKPVTMFVPLDTLRDFIHVDDAAWLTLHWLASSRPGLQTKVIASGQPVTLGYIINQMKNVTKVTLPVANGFHSAATAQAVDLRLQPDFDASTQHHTSVPLPAGLKLIHQELLARLQESGLR